MPTTSDFWAMSRAQSASQPQHVKLTFGELSAYDPATHTGKFKLVMFSDQADPTGNTPIETGFLQIMTPYVGELDSQGNPTGMQFVPKLGAQSLVLFADEAGMHAICGLLLYNAGGDAPPFPGGKINGWKDPNLAHVTTTVDGAIPGDCAGAARLGGNGYTQVSTQGGHSSYQDDIAQKVGILSAAGHSVLLNDAGQILSIVSKGGHTFHLDDAGQVVSILSTGGHHINMNDATGVMGLLPVGGLTPTLNLGSIIGGGASMHPAIGKNDIDTLLHDSSTGIDKLRSLDQTAMVNAIANGLAGSGFLVGGPAASVVAAAINGFLGSLTASVTPNGSAMVNLHE